MTRNLENPKNVTSFDEKERLKTSQANNHDKQCVEVSDMKPRKFIIGVDVGTTNIRSYVYDSEAKVVGRAQKKLDLLYPEENRIEIDPESLWQSLLEVVKDSLMDADLTANSISSMGISTQRGTFSTWDRESGVPFHNFISWKDKRADELCVEWNASLKMKMIRCASYLMYMLTGNERYKAGGLLVLSSALVIMRLFWVLKNIPQVKTKCDQNKVLFGTIETWLVWKLTGGNVHATDSSNASVTGLFDAFQMDWSKWALKMFDIPPNILPVVRDTSDSFGKTLAEIFGSPISINAVVGDQQASMFGQCSFDVGDVNLTLGTGSFLALNTGLVPCVSNKGAYPSVGWTLNGRTTYLLECGASETGTIISWGEKLGFYEKPQESSQVAFSVQDSGGVYFLPAKAKKNVVPDFTGISAFMGLRPQTTKAQLVRSMLEALCFQVHSLYKSAINNGHFVLKKFSVCGGVSNNDFIVQVITNLVSTPVIRSKHADSSSLGAAFLAGLSSGVFENLDEISALVKKEENFYPHPDDIQLYQRQMSDWEEALSSWKFC